MTERKIIVKGLTNSIDWNLGKKNKSNHLFEPLTSVPITGTKNKKIIETKNRKIDNLKRLYSLRAEKNIKIIIPKRI